MTEKFVASNGVIVDQVPTTIGNRFVVQDVNPAQREGSRILSRSNWLDPRDADALREFFQHERDLELGRWRWPENAAIVAWESRRSNEKEVTVLDEGTGYVGYFSRGHVADVVLNEGALRRAARAYFAAHPEPKPLPSEPHTAWVDKYGTDIWWVDGLGVLRCCASPSSNPAKYAPFTQLIKGASHE